MDGLNIETRRSDMAHCSKTICSTPVPQVRVTGFNASKAWILSKDCVESADGHISTANSQMVEWQILQRTD